MFCHYVGLKAVEFVLSRLGYVYISRWVLYASFSGLVFFFKQKTAYEMRISDWSSDVCSSDLSLMSIIEMAEAANPDVLANTYDELAAQRSVREVEGELLPSVELQGSVGYQHERTSRTSEGSTAEILAVVRVPLYQQIGRAHV